MAASFQLDLEHLISRKAPRSIILSVAAGTDIPSFRAFLEVLLGNGREYDSDDIDYDDLSCMCYHVDGDDLAEQAPGLTPPDQSPHSTWPTFRRRQTACALSKWNWKPPR